MNDDFKLLAEIIVLMWGVLILPLFCIMMALMTEPIFLAIAKRILGQ